MGMIQAYRMAIKSILANKVRAFLTMLGVIIGVAAVIAAVALALGSTKSITERIESLGTNLIQISITGRNSNRTISLEDLQNFAEVNNKDITAISPTITTNATLKVGVKKRDTSLLGTNPEYSTVKNQPVSTGRFLTSFDIEYRQKVAVIGSAIVKDIFEGANPLYQDIKINGQLFQVIGVLQETAGGQDQSEDDKVIVPVTVAKTLLQSGEIRNFAVQAATPESVSTVMENLNNFLYSIFRNTNSYRIFNQEQVLSTLGNITGVMMTVLGGIATISLVVGGIGIMNIMLVSVAERTREIGIRKSLGAKRRNILIQFLIEALMVTGLGGVIGIILGLSIIKFVIGGFKIVPEVYSISWICLSFGISLLVGVIFGSFPAYKAANLSPIEALRRE